ncbi:putative monodehydroascorbate reductase [Carex littledalei]|uniref:Putative monodehydroascorbate reductase n=1 Tax=Carex littledalei TaxID=544730 RepID=A0A833VMZ1_9POAL|nr:putative monodehydroascorbate reductase [Carex littledalei]
MRSEEAILSKNWVLSRAYLGTLFFCGVQKHFPFKLECDLYQYSIGSVCGGSAIYGEDADFYENYYKARGVKFVKGNVLTSFENDLSGKANDQAYISIYYNLELNFAYWKGRVGLSIPIVTKLTKLSNDAALSVEFTKSRIVAAIPGTLFCIWELRCY